MNARIITFFFFNWPFPGHCRYFCLAVSTSSVFKRISASAVAFFFLLLYSLLFSFSFYCCLCGRVAYGGALMCPQTHSCLYETQRVVCISAWCVCVCVDLQGNDDHSHQHCFFSRVDVPLDLLHWNTRVLQLRPVSNAECDSRYSPDFSLLPQPCLFLSRLVFFGAKKKLNVAVIPVWWALRFLSYPTSCTLLLYSITIMLVLAATNHLLIIHYVFM